MQILLIVENNPKIYKETVNDEMNSLLYNNTWTIVNLLSGSKTIGCKWIFKRKYNNDGSIQTFITRLVAKDIR
jgi:hypothetical protein